MNRNFWLRHSHFLTLGTDLFHAVEAVINNNGWFLCFTGSDQSITKIKILTFSKMEWKLLFFPLSAPHNLPPTHTRLIIWWKCHVLPPRVIKIWHIVTIMVNIGDSGYLCICICHLVLILFFNAHDMWSLAFGMSLNCQLKCDFVHASSWILSAFR